MINIVTGLPRSGTSLMMRLLETGGVTALTDRLRTADIDNPNGYYEFEPVKQTRQDSSWLDQADGRVVKMVYRLLYDMPTDRQYQVVFMRRRIEEILRSQKAMLLRNNIESRMSDERMSELFEAEIKKFQEWLATQDNISVIEVDFNSLVTKAPHELQRLSNFFDNVLDVDAMRKVVDPRLYRNRVA